MTDQLAALVGRWRTTGGTPGANEHERGYTLALRCCADELEATLSSTAPQPDRLAALEQALATFRMRYEVYRHDGDLMQKAEATEECINELQAALSSPAPVPTKRTAPITRIDLDNDIADDGDHARPRCSAQPAPADATKGHGRALAWILAPAQDQTPDTTALRECTERLKDSGGNDQVIGEMAGRALCILEGRAVMAKARPMLDEIRRLERKLWPEDYPAPSDVVAVNRDEAIQLSAALQLAENSFRVAAENWARKDADMAEQCRERQGIVAKGRAALAAALRQGGGE